LFRDADAKILTGHYWSAAEDDIVFTFASFALFADEFLVF